MKNINFSIEKKEIKALEEGSGNINGYSSLMINKEILGLIYGDYLFLISTKNKEAIKTLRFEGELFFIEKYIDGSFVLNRKIKNKEKNDEKAKTSSLMSFLILFSIYLSAISFAFSLEIPLYEGLSIEIIDLPLWVFIYP